jgi:predicted amidohydrolase
MDHRQKLDLAVVQFTPDFGNKSNNIIRIKKIIEDSESDIIVFPELSISGYFFQSKEESLAIAESYEGEVIQNFQALATKKDSIIVIGFPEAAAGKVYNSAAILFPEKKYSTIYRKTHLFYKERFCFEQGDTGFNVVKYHPWDINIGTMICYDWRFPEASRTLALRGADLIVCPSNLVTDVWHLVMPARTIENKVYLAVANRAGSEERNGELLKFKGLSAIYSYNGSPLAKAGESGDEIIHSEISPAMTRNKSFNDYNNIFSDRRTEYYE